MKKKMLNANQVSMVCFANERHDKRVKLLYPVRFRSDDVAVIFVIVVE